VFTIAIFVPLFQLDSFVHVRAGLGAPAFLAVIVLTMFAVRMFDPRLLWDAAEPRA
jgi:paraquat-inducible protein A